MKKILLNILLVILALIVISFICEKLLKVHYSRYVASKDIKIQTAQKNIMLDDNIGYLLKPDLEIDISLEDGWVDWDKEDVNKDAINRRMFTDHFGFKNDKIAIKRLEKEKVNIIGIGDSMIYMASDIFYNFFDKENLFYYNMAIFRQCPPQYNRILTKYALEHKPEAIIYGITENDFLDMIDFENWEKSGVDWFTYHSGSWCGRPDPKYSGRGDLQYLRRWFPGYTNLLISKGLIQRAKRNRNITPNYHKVLQHIMEADSICQKNNIKLYVVFVPSKNFIIKGESYWPYANGHFDQIIQQLNRKKIPFIDLRTHYKTVEDPSRLYWKTDGHWSFKGVSMAVKLIFDKMKEDNTF